MSPDFDTPLKAALNVVSIGLLLSAIGDLVWARREWLVKALTIVVVALPSLSYRGVVVPVMPVIWLAWWRYRLPPLAPKPGSTANDGV